MTKLFFGIHGLFSDSAFAWKAASSQKSEVEIVHKILGASGIFPKNFKATIPLEVSARSKN